MPTYADFGGWVISTIVDWFVVTADNSKKTLDFERLIETKVPDFACFRTPRFLGFCLTTDRTFPER